MEFDCPICHGAFEAPDELLGGEVTCPHCAKVVRLPEAAPPPAVERPRLAGRSAPPKPRPAPPPKKLTAEEREALRRRFNLVLAGVGAVVLIVAFLVLAQLR